MLHSGDDGDATKLWRLFQKRFPSPLIFSFVIHNQIHRIALIYLLRRHPYSTTYVDSLGEFTFGIPKHLLNSIAQEPALIQYKNTYYILVILIHLLLLSVRLVKSLIFHIFVSFFWSFNPRLWLPYFLLFIFCKNFLQNWCFLQTKNKKSKKKISNIYDHISSPKLQKKIFFENIF